MQWPHQLQGKFLVFDGPDGSGKSTQFSRFAEFCRSSGLKVCEVREPGGTHIGEQIRKVLLDPANTEMSLRCEMMLYMASRAQLIEQLIRPALGRRELVLADRFISSTLAYQGTAGGMSPEEILAVGRVAVGSIWPHLTVLFDVPEDVSEQRMTARHSSTASAGGDRMERKGREYHARVRQGFLAQAQARLLGEYLVMNASPAAEVVFDRLQVELKRIFSAV
ncbi:MAG TPA: dTMP kinase [Phycisphaerales bacterium]|nr:dTMP kinase [Phycisphaerales bacterium]